MQFNRLTECTILYHQNNIQLVCTNTVKWGHSKSPSKYEKLKTTRKNLQNEETFLFTIECCTNLIGGSVRRKHFSNFKKQSTTPAARSLQQTGTGGWRKKK